jgi:GNAT superfamily N-acetyltransferase
MNDVVTVRRVNVWERGDILPLAAAFHAETGIGGTFDGNRLMATVQANKSLIVGLYHNHTTLVGIMVGFMGSHFLTTDTLAQELMWYVMPQFRGHRQAVKMFTEFEAWAVAEGATAISMVSLTTSGDSVKKLYASKGFREVESHHLKFLS